MSAPTRPGRPRGPRPVAPLHAALQEALRDLGQPLGYTRAAATTWRLTVVTPSGDRGEAPTERVTVLDRRSLALTAVTGELRELGAARLVGAEVELAQRRGDGPHVVLLRAVLRLQRATPTGPLVASWDTAGGRR